MRLQVIRTHYPHWGCYSGINQFLKYIDHNRYNVKERLVSDSDQDFPVENRRVRNGLRYAVQRQGMQWYKLSDLTAELRVFIMCLSRKVDIIHFLDGEHSAQFLPSLCKRFNMHKPKIIATYHQPPEMLDSLIINEMLPKLDYITLVSPEQVSYFSQFVGSDKIRVILHGIDTDFFRPGGRPKENGKIKCITVGHYLRDFKAIREVAKALSDYEQIEFQVVTSKSAGLENLGNVKIYSNADDSTLLDLYQQADILFLPLVQATANNALLEGIACGLPVISTNLPSIKAYLNGKEAMLINDNDPKEITDSILYLMNSPKDRERMGIAARKRAQELAWRNIAPEYESIYSDLANSRNS